MLQRRRAAALSRTCLAKDHARLAHSSKPCAYNVMPRFRAVTASQKNALDVLYQQYLKSVGLSVCLSVRSLFDTIRYDTIRDAAVTCAQELT